MKEVFIRGYINYENKKYTFVYEEKKLTVISVENERTTFRFQKYIDFFEGFTLEGLSIVFHIKDDCFYSDGCYICFPRSIIIQRNGSFLIENTMFDALRLSGNNINRFYSNRKMIEFNIEKYRNRR